MAIATDFIIKHVRPWGADAVASLCAPDSAYVAYLRDVLGIDPATIQTLTATWAATGMLEVNAANQPQFYAAADNVARARWSELYSTAFSTVLFADQDALADISEAAAANPSPGDGLRHFNVEIHRGQIPVAVTIARDATVAPQFQLDVHEINIGVDRHGNCVHFGGVVA